MSEIDKIKIYRLRGDDRKYLIYDLTESHKKGRLLYDFSHWIKQDKAHRKRIDYDEWIKIKEFLAQPGTHYIRQNRIDPQTLRLYYESDNNSEYADALGPYKIDDNSFGTYLHEISLSKQQPNMTNDKLCNWTNSVTSDWANWVYDDKPTVTAVSNIEDRLKTVTITANETAAAISNFKNEIKNIKGENEMDTNKIFGKFDFGKVTNDKVRMSPYGLAVKNTDGTWVSYDIENDSIMNVDVFNFDGANFLFKIPVALEQVAAGDMIIHNRTPKFVKHINPDKTLYVVDICSGEVTTVIPTKSPFGFNFVTKVINVLGDFKATTDSPFGNMLPFMLMSGNVGSKDMLPLMLMSGGKFDMSNPLMMYAFMSDGNSADNLLPFLLMNSIGNTTAYGDKTNA